MKSFEAYNPIVLTAYFLSVTLVLMFCQNPIFLLLSFLGALLYVLIRNQGENGKLHLHYFLLFLLFAILNPLFSHNGKTVLFVINDTLITLEAVVYGLVSAGCVITVLYWFYSFTKIMTRDKLLYVFGKLSPKLSLVLSMGLRYVPLFADKTMRIKNTQKALGLYKEDNILDKCRGDLRVFSILLTWALETGIITSDSMRARGYGKGKRTHFSIYKFHSCDYTLLLLVAVMLVFTLLGIGIGNIGFVFYPGMAWEDVNIFGILSYIFYGALAGLPTLIETGDRMKWKYLISKI